MTFVGEIAKQTSTWRHRWDTKGNFNDFDTRALHLLAPLIGDQYLPWSSSSIRPSAIQLVLNDVVIMGRRSLVEFGGGISTLILGEQLKKSQGDGVKRTLLTIEHDLGWVERLNGLCESRGLADFVEIVHAPTTTQRSFYDVSVVTESLEHREPIDLVLVDGPLAYNYEGDTESHPRYPALETVLPFLSSSYSVYLDDIHRGGEGDVLSRWGEKVGVSPTLDRRRGNIGHIHFPSTSVNL